MRTKTPSWLTLYVGMAVLTALFQIWVRSLQCAGLFDCGLSYAKGIVWAAIWPMSWIVYPWELSSRQHSKRRARRIGLRRASSPELFAIGAPGRARTCNPQIRSLVLYPLSYRRLTGGSLSAYWQ